MIIILLKIMNNFQAYCQHSTYFQMPWVPMFFSYSSEAYPPKMEASFIQESQNIRNAQTINFQNKSQNIDDIPHGNNVLVENMGKSKFPQCQVKIEMDNYNIQSKNQGHLQPQKNQIRPIISENNPQVPKNCKKKNCWTKEEEDQLIQYVHLFGEQWKQISEYFKDRNPKQIRQRYLNYLRPNLSSNSWTTQQDNQLIQLMGKYGHQWKHIQKKMKTRSQNQIKNRFYGHVKKVLDSKKSSKKQRKQL